MPLQHPDNLHRVGEVVNLDRLPVASEGQEVAGGLYRLHAEP